MELVDLIYLKYPNQSKIIFQYINWLIKIVYYKAVKIIINELYFTGIIINIIIRY